ncbi:MAG: pilus assembly PilX family protein [Planctomycetota bacterium]
MKSIIKKLNSSRKGFVLPLAAMMVVILLIVGIALIRLARGARLMSARTTAEISARAAADSGITQAIYLMNEKLATEGTWNNSNLPEAVNDVALPNSNALFSYTITGDPTNGFLITSTGKSGFSTRTIYAKLGVASSWFGIGVKEGINLKLGTSFYMEPPDSPFAIRTNSIEDDAIILKAGVVVPGDVIIGPGGDMESVLNAKSSTVIRGNTYVSSDEIQFPSVVLPSYLEGWTTESYSYDSNGLSGTIRYDSMDIPNNQDQHIVGDCVIYVNGTIHLGQGSSIIVDDGASLVLYLGGDMVTDNLAGFENLTVNPDDPTNLDSHDAHALKIYGLDTCLNIDLKAKGDFFFGAVYAPEADLDVYAKNELAGAFTGKSFDLKNGSKFTFIAALATGDINEHGAYFARRWWE